ncbi:MAG: superoxide dismutase [Elusimicrobia bacterium]|nr:superoxide dismutase [Elusimicrobiota bacterium]
MYKILIAATAFLLTPALDAQVKIMAPAAGFGVYAPKDCSAFPTNGVLSYTASTNHVRLYQAYVKNVNNLLQRFKELEQEGKADTADYAELKRRFGWEFNGMRLHELYFAQFGAAPLAENSELRQALAAQFGSFDAWQAAFTGLAQTRGAGWAVLAYDRPAKRFLNVWITDHDKGVPAGVELLLVLDLFEHAYLTDFQLDRARYAQAAWGALNWPLIEKRFAK